MTESPDEIDPIIRLQPAHETGLFIVSAQMITQKSWFGNGPES